MGITDHQAKFLAYELTRRLPPDDSERLSATVAGAQVDLNPHQVDAALFAFASPLAQGALLADEVGLGKTIEAGLVIAQRWAERRRRILVITPSNLRKQWHQELSEKFFLPCTIMETRSYNEAMRAGRMQPLNAPEAIVICSYQFARAKASEVHAVPWDLVVIDEAHRLRNVYKPSNVTANTLRMALAGRQKLLLTATPLQNSLMELFGLVSFIDERAFGDAKSFREQFAGGQERALASLRERLRPICHRTLRRQVTAYVPYTRRLAMVQEFTPAESEDRLYDLVSEYLQRDNLQALPPGQRTLITLVLRKLLASSTFAIASALRTMAGRLRARLAGSDDGLVGSELAEDFESLDATSEEWDDGEVPPPLSEADRVAYANEIADLERFAALAESIPHNAKGSALIRGLEAAFERTRTLGGAEKAIIFTESRKTQAYLLRLLADSPWADGIVLFNGTNTDEGSKKIYAEWLARHANSDRVTGSRSADMRSALVDYFRESGRIMIATEAGAEGINLQFCSLVVNYDLPWNPQRIEQRIGRCHRYGQKHDVVVVNFLNRKNEADARVFALLDQKFKLFEGVFGASDEVLGAIESGVDLERRIAAIYQQCRHPDEIRGAFDDLQRELSLEIDEAMDKTRRKLLENFDDEVREKLRTRDTVARESLDRFERDLMTLTRHELAEVADFDGAWRFVLRQRPDWMPPAADVPLGVYELPRRSGNVHFYRLNHPLGEAVVDRARRRDLPAGAIAFDYSGYDGRVHQLEALVGESGWMHIAVGTVSSLDLAEDHLLVAAITERGVTLDEQTVRRMLSLPARIVAAQEPPPDVFERLFALIQERKSALQSRVASRNDRFFATESEKLDGWADDLKVGLEREIKELDRAIREARRGASAANSLEEKLTAQKEVRRLEGQRNLKRRALFDEQDRIDAKRAALIAEIEARMKQVAETETLFTVRWEVR